MAFVERAHRLARRDAGFNQRIGHRFAGGVFRIAFQPVGVVQQAVAEHRLGFGIGHRSRWELLREARRILANVGKMRRVAAFVEQGVEPVSAAAHLPRLRQAGEVDACRHPFPLAHKRRHRAVHKAVFILAFAHQQIEVHLGAAKADVQAFEAVDPTLQRTRKREVRIQLAGDVACAGEAHVPRLQRLAALIGC